eukprot:Seg1688.4 transcript_id=Seg1688.4/GoldUCD/mRNA.D3Y31 product="28S ribosomal protein S29 mitochondrial" pseudo=true protein_id=Seg1688.4/GoldUCD/D3Y31
MAALRCAKTKCRDLLSQWIKSCQSSVNKKPCVRLKSSVAEKRKALQSLGIYCPFEPIDQEERDISQIYRITVKEMKAIFTHGFPTRTGDRQIDYTDCHMVIRKPTWDILQSIKSLKEGDEPPRFVIHGDDGTGKSIALSHMIHLCANLNWLILHLPSVHKLTQSRFDVEPSTWKQGRHDQPIESTHWLKAFRTVNQKFLEQIKTTKDYKWGRQESISEGSVIGRVVELGMSRTTFATDAVGIILKEIQQTKGINVLYAVDEFNGLFTTSSIRNKESEYIHPQEFSLVRHFTRILEPERSLPQGCYAMALSRNKNFRHFVHSLDIKDQLGKKGMALLGDHIPVLMENFTEEELHNYLQLLLQLGLFNKDLTESMENEITFLTDRNPADVMRLIKGH